VPDEFTIDESKEQNAKGTEFFVKSYQHNNIHVTRTEPERPKQKPAEGLFVRFAKDGSEPWSEIAYHEDFGTMVSDGWLKWSSARPLKQVAYAASAHYRSWPKKQSTSLSTGTSVSSTMSRTKIILNWEQHQLVDG
jgi:predicted Zn-dependent protease